MAHNSYPVSEREWRLEHGHKARKAHRKLEGQLVECLDTSALSPRLRRKSVPKFSPRCW
jgi:hypothetical protein